MPSDRRADQAVGKIDRGADKNTGKPALGITLGAPLGAVMFMLAVAGIAVNVLNLLVLDSHIGHGHGEHGGSCGCGGPRP